MCETLKTEIQRRYLPFLRDVPGEAARELAESLEEMIRDIDEGIMEMWECGEMVEEFKRYPSLEAWWHAMSGGLNAS